VSAAVAVCIVEKTTNEVVEIKAAFLADEEIAVPAQAALVVQADTIAKAVPL
jgi:transcriptional regulator CtsR